MELLCLLTSMFCLSVPLGSLCEEGQLIPWLCTAGLDSTIKTMSANVGPGLARVQYSQGRVKPRDSGSALLTAVPLWLHCGMCKEASLPGSMHCCREKVRTDCHPPLLLLRDLPASCCPRPLCFLPPHFLAHFSSTPEK